MFPESAREHDRLVISEDGTVAQLFVGAKVSCQCRPSKFVVVGSGAQRAFDHDVERRGNMRRPAICLLPGLRRLRQVEIRYGEAAQPSLWLGAAPGCTFVTNLSARSRRRTWPRRDGRRVIVRLDLQQNMDIFVVVLVGRIAGLRKEPPPTSSANHRGIVAIGRKNIVAGEFIGVADHLEQRPRLLLPINRPARIEDLVAAVLAVGLRKHIQLNVGRIASQLA